MTLSYVPFFCQDCVSVEKRWYCHFVTIPLVRMLELILTVIKCIVNCACRPSVEGGFQESMYRALRSVKEDHLTLATSCLNTAR